MFKFALHHKKIAWLGFGLALAILAGLLLLLRQPPLQEKTLADAKFGEIAVAEPLWGASLSVLVFADTGKFAGADLARQLAKQNISAMVVDSGRFYAAMTHIGSDCLDNQAPAAEIDQLLAGQADAGKLPVLITGMEAGALLPYLHSLNAQIIPAAHLSLNFNIDSAAQLHLCAPLNPETLPRQTWRTVWTDQPVDATARFTRRMGTIDSRIAAFDTPLPELLLTEVKLYLGKPAINGPTMPVVEVPALKSSETITIFYSGDGGWRDLDRTVANAMAAQNFPVVGVDVLRYFWTAKTAAEAAADLTATMNYYQQHWGVKRFVLAGYSFGADILPALYNRLPSSSQDSVILLNLIALGKQADFEIHVSGWLGRSSGELALAPELAQIPKQKLLCIYGSDEKAETACTSLTNSPASILELPGGHHFDADYPKLTRQILDVYRQHGITAGD